MGPGRSRKEWTAADGELLDPQVEGDKEDAAIACHLAEHSQLLQRGGRLGEPLEQLLADQLGTGIAPSGSPQQ